MGQSALCVSAHPEALSTTRRRAPWVPRWKLTQRACGSLVMGLAALTGEFVPPLERLAKWFAGVTNSDTYDTTDKDTGHAADVVLRLYIGSDRPTDTPCLD